MTIFDTNYRDDKKEKEKEIELINNYKQDIEFTIFCWIIGIFFLFGITLFEPYNSEINPLGKYFMYFIPIVFFVWPFIDGLRGWFIKKQLRSQPQHD